MCAEQLVPQLYAHMKAFCVKLNLFKTQLLNFNVVHFPTLSEIRTAYPQANLSAKKGKYVSVITCFEMQFRQRFQDFSVIEKEIKLFNLQLELIEIQCDDSLKNQHQQLSLPEFYRGLEKEKFPLMRRHAKKMISLFGSTYICEQTFSLLTLNKSRLRTKMTDSHLHNDLRISTTKFTPDLPAILRSKAQQHCSP
uniref:HAT C-terminal dimerisation domain-containing protein n=1 Tax=Pygocentrus nattereri TaxID=42514 RepID=A0AAR2IL57_PYGNA